MRGVKWTPEPGTRFGRLVVVDTSRRVPPVKPRQVGARRFLCHCDCGAEVLLDPTVLKGGMNQSCGCLRRELGRVLGSSSKRHGLWNHPLYKTWYDMVRRCHDPVNPAYHWYGARGIEVHAEWRDSPAAFVAYLDRALGPRPEGFSLDRVDNDRGYEPGNLRWADSKTQNNNRRPASSNRWSNRGV